jgi:chromate transporter
VNKDADMMLIEKVRLEKNHKDIASEFLKLGGTAFGGAAVMGIIQTEIQEKRQWVSKERFVEGLSLVYTLPGATAVELAIFLGYARGGWWGGVLAGLCFALPAFGVMLVLTIAHAYLGPTPIMRGGLYGVGPVVLGIFGVAVYRLSSSAVTTLPQVIIALTAAAAASLSPLGIAAILAAAAGVGILLFHSPRVGASILIVMAAFLAIIHFPLSVPLPLVATPAKATASAYPADLMNIGTFFFKVGALTFGGGLTMLALIQEQVVAQYHWLTHQEFIDGLALSQIIPGPMLMVAAYVGYKVAGLGGAVIAASATFLPSFVIMFSILPIFERVRGLVWIKAAMRGVGPAVIGALAVFLVRMAPHALPDPFAIAILIAIVIALSAWRIGAVKLMVAGSVFGVLWSRFFSFP